MIRATHTNQMLGTRGGWSLLELQVAFIVFGVALAGIGPLAVMQVRQLKKIEYRLRDQTTYYLVPPSDAWARKIGATALTQTTTPAAVASPVTVRVNFQRPDGPVPAGTFGGATYLADSGSVYGYQGNGFNYGWNNTNLDTRNRNSARSADERYDTLAHTQQYGVFTWEIAVPNGSYDVHLVAGDADFYDGIFKFNVEGVLGLSGTPTDSARWIEGTIPVVVTDGRITLTNASGSWNNKLCFVDIVPAVPRKVVSIVSVTKSLISEDFSVRVSAQ